MFESWTLTAKETEVYTEMEAWPDGNDLLASLTM